MTEEQDRFAQLAAAGAPSDEEAAAPTGDRLELVALRVGTRWFGVPVDDVREVVIKGFVTRMPLAPQHIQGLTLVHGRLIPVVDVGVLIGATDTGESATMLPRLVMVADADLEIGVVADEARGLVEVHPPDSDQPAPPDRPSFVSCEVEWEEQLVCVLDSPALIQAAMPDRGRR